ncbi:nucleotidyltransferase domain-containing protein [candidate division KSB1 bacterium]|nr:nucleotidyltransferase domain-containing protein [candidate division KSB1 bacterium]
MINKLKKIFKDTPEIAAAYLFGSAAAKEPVVNDLDFLILPFPEVDFHTLDFELLPKISQATGFKIDQIDIVVFDMKMVKPGILYEAVNKGIILKNESPGLLTDKIEALSRYFLENEFLIQEKEKLQKEELEEFCAN